MSVASQAEAVGARAKILDDGFGRGAVDQSDVTVHLSADAVLLLT
jgi:hypothetical protein